MTFTEFDTRHRDHDGTPVVLLIEDSEEIRMVADVNLQANGFRVCSVSRGSDALEAAAADPPDVAILDIGLPDVSGFEVLDGLRGLFPDIPVMLLTARWHEADRIEGFERGADDYLIKPFYVSELVARVRALARRSNRSLRLDRIEFGELVIDGAGRQVICREVPVELTAKEFDLLEYLARHPGRAFSREDLLRAVWDSSSQWQDASTVTEHIRRIRIKIEANPAVPQFIDTVRGVGYRFG